MVKAVKQSGIVDCHPLKKLFYQTVLLFGIGRIFEVLQRVETNWLVVRDPVPQIVCLDQLIEHEGLVVLYDSRTRPFCREDFKLIPSRGGVLVRREPIPPKAATQLGQMTLHFRIPEISWRIKFLIGV